MKAVLLLIIQFVLLPPAHVSPQEREATGEEFQQEDLQARAESRRMRRLDADGNLPDDALQRAWEQLNTKEIAQKGVTRAPSDAGVWNWEWLGPGNIGGRTRALVINPVNPDIMVAGTAGGGIWRTTNGGSWWWPVSDFLPALPVVSLVMDPTNPQVLYAGTGERVGSNFWIPGAGVFKSTSGGLTWSQLQNTAGPEYHYVGKLAHHPVSSGTVLAATDSGVYRTTNGGSDWGVILKVPEGACDVDYDPSDPNRIWVGTYQRVYLSTDAGDHWIRQTTGAAGKMPDSLGRCEIAFAPARSDIVYVSPGKDVPIVNDQSDVIYRSTDGGSTWDPWRSTNADRWSNAIWVSPTDSNLVVWGGFGDLLRTTDGGATLPTFISDWRWYDKGKSAHGDQHAIVPHPGYNGTTNRTVFFCNDGGIQKATNVSTVTDTIGWVNLANNLGVSQFFGGAVSTGGDLAIGGTQDNGILLYTQAGGQQGWSLGKFPDNGSMTGDGQWAAVDFNLPTTIYVTYPRLIIMRSNNSGASFSEATSGLGDRNGYADWLAPFVMDPSDPGHLVAGGGKIWETLNGANEWHRIRDFASGTNAPVCTAIDIAKTNSDVIWVGYNNGLVSHTTVAGDPWADHPKPWGTRAVTDIAINPWNQNEVLVTVGGYSTTTVWITTDAGTSWTNRNGTPPHDLPAVQVNTVRYHPLQPNWIYVGSDLGVFASEDKGVTWSVTPRYNTGNEGPNNAEVVELTWQGTSSLVAVTHGRGMYRCTPLPVVYVDFAYVGPENGSQLKPYNTVDEAVSNYGPGALVSIRNGTYDGPPMVIDKRGRLTSTGGPAVIK